MDVPLPNRDPNILVTEMLMQLELAPINLTLVKTSIIMRKLLPAEKDDIDVDGGTSFVFRVCPRTFQLWHKQRNQPLPCFHPTSNRTYLHWTNPKYVQRQPARRGLIFIILLKALQQQEYRTLSHCPQFWCATGEGL